MQINKNKTTFFFIFFLLSNVILLIFSSCNEAPTEMGMNLLQDTVSVVFVAGDDSIIQGDSSYAISKSSSLHTGAFFVGKAKGMEAATFIRWSFPVDYGWITESDIISAELLIFPKYYALGDTLGSNLLSFDIKKIVKSWTLEDITPKDVFESENLYEKTPIASWSGNIKYKESAKKDTLDTISINISKSLCVEWFRKSNSLPVPEDSTIWGLALLPKEESTVINQFRDSKTVISSGINNALSGSVMKIIYKDKEKDTLITLYVNSSFSKNFINFKEKPPKDKITVQGGVKIHSRLHFDISILPELASVNYTEIILTLDTANSYFGNIKQDSLLRLILYRDLNNPDALGNDESDGDFSCVGRRKEGTNEFIFRSAEIGLMYFLTKQSGKGSLVLAPKDIDADRNTLDRFVFYGADAADTDKRPQIRLVYSVLNPLVQ